MNSKYRKNRFKKNNNTGTKLWTSNSSKITELKLILVYLCQYMDASNGEGRTASNNT